METPMAIPIDRADDPNVTMESLNASEVRGPHIYYKTAENHTDCLSILKPPYSLILLLLY